MDGAAALVARPIAGLLPVLDERAPLRVLIASLAPGGAERIVLEWLFAEVARGRAVELAVLHARRNALALPEGVMLHVRQREDPASFLERLACDWCQSAAPVSTHLIPDSMLEILWQGGVRTVPAVHNSREGWRNDPSAWRAEHVPMAVACAESVRFQLLEAGCGVPVVALRHRPWVADAAFDSSTRQARRAELGIAPGTFLVAAVGALKPQKDHSRAIEVLARLCHRRDAALVILGGALDRAGLAELDRVVDAALRLRVADRLRLPGFVPAIAPYLAACDALLNVSRFEGLSIAVQEALAAGLPVVATDVGGQREIEHPALELVESDAAPDTIAERLARHPVREALAGNAWRRAPRVWSMSTTARLPRGAHCETVFVTANLNAGGAQRSLVNLACAIARRHALAVAVCGETTHEAFVQALHAAGVERFRPSAEGDDFAVAESLLAYAQRRAARTICFWNAAPGVKLLVAQFAPPELRLIDVSPGAYSFEEMDAVADFAQALAFTAERYYRRLDVLVLKYRTPEHPACRRVEVIPNGVALRDTAPRAPSVPRFLVSGRIAPSKRLEVVIEAFRGAQARHPGAELHIVGPVEERHASYADRLVAQAASLSVRFRGAGFDLAHLDEPWSAAVVLGTHQGSPNAVLEAMAAGIPVIANDSGGTRELVVDGATGWLLPEAADDAVLARAMHSVITNPEQARERAERALVLVRSHCSIEAMAARYLALLGTTRAHEKMGAWNSDSVPVAPPPSSSVPSPATAVR